MTRAACARTHAANTGVKPCTKQIATCSNSSSSLIAEDEVTREFIAIIKFRDINGQIRRLEQPKSSLRKIDQLKEALDNAGAYLSTNDKGNGDAIRALSLTPQ